MALKTGDLLVVDASDGAIASGQTSAAVLSRLHRNGISLYSHYGLHAKIFIADSMLFVSSANASESSESRLLEAGIETDNPNAVSGSVGLIERLTRTSIEIDSSFITRIKKIKVQRNYHGSAKSTARRVGERQRDPVTWLLGVHDIADPQNADELHRIEVGTEKAERHLLNSRSSVGYIRYARNARIKEARQGDNIIIIDSQSAATPQRVYRHASVLRLQEEPNCNRLFYEIVPTAEKNGLPWSRFKRLAKFVGLPERMSRNTIRQLSASVSNALHEHWGEF
jgi:hypothetical protein